MPLFINSSNALESLVERLVDTMQSTNANAGSEHDSLRAALTPVYIVTQTDGMSSWLKLQIAERTGIAANIRFLKPNELISLVYREAGGRFEKALSTFDIQWLIYKALAAPAIRDHYPEVSAYYMVHGVQDQVKRIALAQELADLFDQYEVYRMDMLRAWAENKLTTRSPEEMWQREIWKLLKEQAAGQLPDKDAVRTSIVHHLKEEVSRDRVRRRIPAVYFFGTSLITSYHFDILEALAQYIPVHFFLPNPAPHLYWYEDPSLKKIFYMRRRGVDLPGEGEFTNPLLINWGKLIQNTLRLVFRSDEAINSYQDDPVEPRGSSLLSCVQSMVHQNTVTGNGIPKLTDKQLEDESITIRSCYSVAREVETLYNYLIRIFDKNPQRYSPRDVVVHVTDINRYASYIRAVFDNAPYRMRYTIADESFAASDTISQALYEILSLDEKSFTSERVVQLLNFSSIRKHFRIADLPEIRRVVESANIRHGISGDQETESVFVSWRYGMDRILYGLCIGSDEEYTGKSPGFYPLSELEGSATNEIIHFVYMVNKLISLLEEREEHRTVASWVDYIYRVLHSLVFDTEEKDDPEYAQLNEHIKSVLVGEDVFGDKISFQVFLRQFLPGLNDLSKTYNFARGGITFCSLIPMRSIPFKIVAMLGLQFDKFPRRPVASGFDLMHQYPLPGDRNIRTNDKHLFLETLMSAGDHLYLSYIGQQIQNNSVRPPSILIDELLSFIEISAETPDLVRNKLITQEPLHSFSPRYGHDERYYNYLLTSVPEFEFVGAESAKDDVRDAFSFSDLYRFLSNTAEWYYKYLLGIRFDDESVRLPESELFELDRLEQWSIKSELLDIDSEMVPEFIDRKKKLGAIPLKSGGDYVVQAAELEIEELRQRLQAERKGHTAETKFFELDLSGCKLTAEVPHVFGNNILVPCLSKSVNKYYLRAWLIQLIAAASGTSFSVVFVGETTQRAKTVDADDARNVLLRLRELMDANRKHLHLFDICWIPTDKGVTKAALEKAVLARTNEGKYARTAPDKYLILALREGWGTDLLEDYNKIYQEVVPHINKMFN